MSLASVGGVFNFWGVAKVVDLQVDLHSRVDCEFAAFRSVLPVMLKITGQSSRGPGRRLTDAVSELPEVPRCGLVCGQSLAAACGLSRRAPTDLN